MTILPGPDLTGDALLATEVADFLAENGVPFREAHHVSGRLVKLSEQANRRLDDWSLEELQQLHPAFTADIFNWLESTQQREDSSRRHGLVEISRQTKQIRKPPHHNHSCESYQEIENQLLIIDV